MTRIEDRRKAIILRKQGKTYSEIRKSLGVSKSTLSYWLKKLPLTQDQLNILKDKYKKSRIVAIEKTSITKGKKREARQAAQEMKQKKYLLPLSKKELFIGGLFLYWGEGTKVNNYTVSLCNTDPGMVKFYYHWLTKSLKVSKDRIKAYIHIYSDMDPKKTINYWSNYLGIEKDQFIKPYIKRSKRKEIDHKGYGNGTCGLYIYDVRIKERIIASMDAIKKLFKRK